MNSYPFNIDTCCTPVRCLCHYMNINMIMSVFTAGLIAISPFDTELSPKPHIRSYIDTYIATSIAL